MQLVRYTANNRDDWNAFVGEAKNGTFMLNRNYMDYHSQRFSDCSLMFIDKERIFAVMPANIDADNRCVYSHQGLTYGGLVMGNEVDAARVLEIFSLTRRFFKEELGAERLVYKSIP